MGLIHETFVDLCVDLHIKAYATKNLLRIHEHRGKLRSDRKHVCMIMNASQS